jgi:hypothetical protein
MTLAPMPVSRIQKISAWRRISYRPNRALVAEA